MEMVYSTVGTLEGLTFFVDVYRSELRQQPVEEQGGPVIQRWSRGGVVYSQQVTQDLAPLVVREVNQPGRKLRKHQIRRVLHAMQQLQIQAMGAGDRAAAGQAERYAMRKSVEPGGTARGRRGRAMANPRCRMQETLTKP